MVHTFQAYLYRAGITFLVGSGKGSSAGVRRAGAGATRAHRRRAIQSHGGDPGIGRSLDSIGVPSLGRHRSPSAWPDGLSRLRGVCALGLVSLAV